MAMLKIAAPSETPQSPVSPRRGFVSSPGGVLDRGGLPVLLHPLGETVSGEPLDRIRERLTVNDFGEIE